MLELPFVSLPSRRLYGCSPALLSGASHISIILRGHHSRVGPHLPPTAPTPLRHVQGFEELLGLDRTRFLPQAVVTPHTLH